ncbi:hypothetical protein LTR66_012725 [Elasticomyces elasticus]|nr:hypothetical protein LTR66_012725 [Elasticomyces elasticus]
MTTEFPRITCASFRQIGRFDDPQEWTKLLRESEEKKEQDEAEEAQPDFLTAVFVLYGVVEHNVQEDLKSDICQLFGLFLVFAQPLYKSNDGELAFVRGSGGRTNIVASQDALHSSTPIELHFEALVQILRDASACILFSGTNQSASSTASKDPDFTGTAFVKALREVGG